MPSLPTFLHNPIHQLGGPMVPGWNGFVVKLGIDLRSFRPVSFVHSPSPSVCTPSSATFLDRFFFVHLRSLPLERRILMYTCSPLSRFSFPCPDSTIYSSPSDIRNLRPLEAITSTNMQTEGLSFVNHTTSLC